MYRANRLALTRNFMTLRLNVEMRKTLKSYLKINKSRDTKLQFAVVTVFIRTKRLKNRTLFYSKEKNVSDYFIYCAFNSNKIF